MFGRAPFAARVVALALLADVARGQDPVASALLEAVGRTPALDAAGRLADLEIEAMSARA